MPAVLRNVSKTYTLEQQRQEINLLAQDVYNLGGGSGTGGLTGTFSLSNGTRFSPSLNFTNFTSTGAYLNGNALSITSFTNEVARFDSSEVTFLKTVTLRDAVIDSVSIDDSGFNYNPGSYVAIDLNGGSGTSGQVNATISPFVGTIAGGSSYTPGDYTNVSLSGGSGSGATADITVRGLVGTILSPGSLYTPNTYTDVPLQGGSGTGATADITFSGDGGNGQAISVVIKNNGTGYANGNILTVNNSDLPLPVSAGGGFSGGSGFQWQINQIPYIVSSVTPTSNGIGGYEVNDVLTASNAVLGYGSITGSITSAGSGYTNGTYTDVPVYNVPTATFVVTTVANPGTPPPNFVYQIDGVTQQPLNLIIGNTYRFDISDLSNNTHPFFISGGNYDELPDGIVVLSNGVSGVQDAFVDLIIKPTVANGTTILYNCYSHPGMGNTITLTTGSAGSYSDNALARVVVDGGAVTSFAITDPGRGIKNNDILSVIPSDVGGVGSGLTYQISNVATPTGSGFSYTLSEVGSLSLVAKSSDGSGYQLNDTLIPKIPFRIKILSYGFPGDGVPFKFYLDLNDGNGPVETPTLTLYKGYTYIFDYNDPINFSHGFNISETQDGIHNGGIPFTGDGLVPDVAAKTISLEILDSTPSTLYYYCTVQSAPHIGMGGTLNISTAARPDVVDPVILIDQISPTSSIELGLDGTITTDNINVSSVGAQSGNFASNVNVDNLSLSGSTISSTNSTDLRLTPANNLYINGGVVGNVNKKLSVLNSSVAEVFAIDLEDGSISSDAGSIHYTDPSAYLNIADKVKLYNDSGYAAIEEITDVPETGNGLGIRLTPDIGKSIFVNSTASVAIPVGTTLQRPADAIQGSIRFNTTALQYEGYNGSSWSSLGGVRDVNNDTYIIPEKSSGSNEDTLYFVNFDKQSLTLSASDFSFYTARNIRAYDVDGLEEWLPLTAYSLGDSVYTLDNVYEVTVAGTTGSSEPTHTSAAAVNGDVEFTWIRSTKANLTFSSSIKDIYFNTPTEWNNNLKIQNSTISSLIDDVIIQPLTGKNVEISSTTSLVLPVGNNNNKGAPKQGSVRYNTADSQFEGFNGNQWGGLGGVKDINQDTEIKAESSPGANEDILFFYNNSVNTLNVAQTYLEFNGMDVITSVSNNLDINADNVSFANDSFSIINDTGTSTTKLLTSLSNFDIANSSGLTTDTLLRLDDTGKFIVNTAYSTGSFSGLTVVDKDLKFINLTDTRITTVDIPLLKGTTDSGSSVIYQPANDVSAKIIVSAHNVTSGDKELIEYNVCNTSSDIIHNAYGEVRTSSNLIDITFDFDPASAVRLNVSLDSSVTTSDEVVVTIISTIIKK